MLMLVEQMLSTHLAFEAMREFLRRFNEREDPKERLVIDLLLSWTEFQHDGLTTDPAQWDDWLQAVAFVLDTPGSWPAPKFSSSRSLPRQVLFAR